MSSPKDLLTHFSLSPQEAEIYLASLTLGTASVVELAKKTGKSRTAIYFHINHLLQKGLLKETRKGKAVRYLPTPPRDVVDQIDRWTTDLKSLLPLLESLKKADLERPEITITESKSGFYRVFDEIASMPKGSVFRVIEGADAMSGELSLLTQTQWQAFFQRMVDRTIVTRAIFTQSSFNLPTKKLNEANIKLLQQRIWQIRSIPERALPFQKLLMVYGHTIAFLLPEASLVVRIRHQHIAEMLELLFEGLFHYGETVKTPWASSSTSS